jgi:hypothetical protein
MFQRQQISSSVLHIARLIVLYWYQRSQPFFIPAGNCMHRGTDWFSRVGVWYEQVYLDGYQYDISIVNFSLIFGVYG